MPSHVLHITQEQVFHSQNKSTKLAQAAQHVENILADRTRPPHSLKRYEKIKGFATHGRISYHPGTILLAGPIYTKTRPAIVVAPLSSSFLVLPVLTHSGHGLKHHLHHLKHEYMSICDQRPGGWYIPQNDMPVLLTDAGVHMNGLLLLPQSTVHFTAPFDILYTRKTLILGKLCEHSTRVLLEHYQGRATRAPLLVRGRDPGGQARGRRRRGSGG